MLAGSPRRGREPDRVRHERRVDEDLVGRALHREEALGRQHRLGGRHVAGHPLDDDELLGLARVVDDDLHHELVDLRLRQGVRALGLDRVLRREDEERVRDLVGLAADRDLALLHDLEQRALDLGRRAVDLVGEEQVREHRPQRRPELAGLLVVDAGADEVGRDEVRRELDALELAADRVGDGLDGHRLGEARHALDEEVAAAQQRDDEPFQEVVLADDDLLDLVEQPLHRGGSVLTVVSVHARFSSCRGLSVGRQAGGAAGDIDGDGEADPDEHVVCGRVDEGGDDADEPAVAIDEGAAAVARIDRGIDLEEAGQRPPGVAAS